MIPKQSVRNCFLQSVFSRKYKKLRHYSVGCFKLANKIPFGVGLVLAMITRSDILSLNCSLVYRKTDDVRLIYPVVQRSVESFGIDSRFLLAALIRWENLEFFYKKHLDQIGY